jgi:hypothetical protein
MYTKWRQKNCHKIYQNCHKIYQMAVNRPNDHKIYQHRP